MCGRHALEPAHGPVAPFDAAMVLLEMMIPVAAGPVRDPLAEFCPAAVNATEPGLSLAWMPQGRAKVPSASRSDGERL
jgi:hypothetical protein